MEQASRTRAHLERIMLVCGLPNAGKSRLIRRMFADHFSEEDAATLVELLGRIPGVADGSDTACCGPE